MPILPRKKREVETILSIENVDPVTCRERLKGDVDEQGRCLIRIRETGDPNKVELVGFKYLGRGSQLPKPQETGSGQ